MIFVVAFLIFKPKIPEDTQHIHKQFPKIIETTFRHEKPPSRPRFPCRLIQSAYLLGLLAINKCSICSYQCDNWYVSNLRLACHINYCWGECPLELAQRLLSVALAWHKAGRSTPFGVTMYLACPCHDSLPYRSKEQKRHDNKHKKNKCSSSSLLASLRKGQ